MNGATWDERQPSDWLASNGRWYPRSEYPSRWDMLALPPAPGHGLATSLESRITERVPSQPKRSAPSRQQPSRQQPSRQQPSRQQPSRQQPARAAAPPPLGSQGAAPPPPRRPAPPPSPPGPQPRTAPAEATNVRTYKYRIEQGAPPPKGLPSAQDTPAPPGRIAPLPDDSNESVVDATEPAAAPPARVEHPPAPPAPGNSKESNAGSNPLSGLSILGKDFDSLLGNARKRLEEAIDESADRENWR